MADAEQIKKGLKRLVHPLLRLQKGRSRSILRGIIGTLISLMLFGCINRTPPVQLLELPDVPINNEVRRLNGSINEVAPPAVFLDLDDLLAGVAPQVAIASPKPNQIIDTTRLSAKIKLRGLSIYKDEKLELGPHLQVSLDNQPARSIYSLEEDLEFSDLAPGSHTLRVLAVKPWGESFKNEAAYAQTTFHVFASSFTAPRKAPTAHSPSCSTFISTTRLYISSPSQIPALPIGKSAVRSMAKALSLINGSPFTSKA
jgi:hypothetical protein